MNQGMARSGTSLTHIIKASTAASITFYADIKNPVLEKSQLRLGRQYQYSVENILFDGAKYEQQVGPVEAHVFGGLRASQYSSPDDDTVAGGGVAFRPFIDTHASLDYIRIVDDDP